VSDTLAVETEKKVMVKTEVAATGRATYIRVEVRFEGCWGTTSMSISGV
jgi:hypothetical protein